MEGFIVCVAIVAGIVNFIFFCKMWGMCNDVEKLTKYLVKEEPKKEENEKPQCNDGKFLFWLFVFVLGILILCCVK